MTSEYSGDKKHLHIPFFDPTKPPPNFNIFSGDGNLLNTPFAPPELKKSFGDNVILKSLRRTTDADTQILTQKIISPVKPIFTSPLQPPPMPNLVLPSKQTTPQTEIKNSITNEKNEDDVITIKIFPPIEVKENQHTFSLPPIAPQSLHSAPPSDTNNQKNYFFGSKNNKNTEKTITPFRIPPPPSAPIRHKPFNLGSTIDSSSSKNTSKKQPKSILKKNITDDRYRENARYFAEALSAFQMICLEESKNEAVKSSLKAHHRVLEYKECFAIMKILNDTSSIIYKHIKCGLSEKLLVNKLYKILNDKFKKQEFKSVTHPRINIVYNIVKEYGKILKQEKINPSNVCNMINDDIVPYRKGSENIKKYINERNVDDIVLLCKQKNEGLDKSDKNYVNIEELMNLLNKRKDCNLYNYKENDPLVKLIKKVREIAKIGVEERIKESLILKNKEIEKELEKEKQKMKQKEEQKEMEKERKILRKKLQKKECKFKIHIDPKSFNEGINFPTVIVNDKVIGNSVENFLRIKQLFDDLKYETLFKDSNNFKPLSKLYEDGGKRIFYVVDRIDRKKCIIKEYLNFGFNKNLMAQAKCEIECLVKNRQRMFQSVLGFGINLRLNRLYIGYDINVNTLDKIIRKKSYTPDMAFIRLTSQQLMEGLYHLERIGIIHKDIKPENIYVKPNREQILIGNFHYCTYLQEPQNLVYNDKSLNYRAIEAFIEPEKVSHSVDVWSAGCVINEMLNFGRLLFEGKTPLAIIGSIYEIIGAPTRENCEGYDEIPFYKYIHFASSSDSFKPNFNMDNFHQYLNDFFERIFTHSISDRLSAKEALFHPFLKDLATEGLKKSEKWRKDYDALSDHSLKFEAQIRYVNALVEKIKEQKDRQNLDIKNKDMCKIITPKQLKRKRKLQKNNKSNPLLKELAKKPKLEPDDIKKISHLIEPTKKVSLEEKINFYKKQDVRKIFRSNTLFRRILFKTGKIELPLAYEILAKIEYGKMKLSDVKSGKVMKRKMVNLETRLKLKREKRLNKIKEIIKKRVEIKEKRICQALKRNLKNQPLPATVVKDKLIKESETTPPKKPINPESFMPPVFLNVEKKPEFAVPKIPEIITVKKQKSIENIVKEKKNIVEERKTKIKLLEISELPAEPIKVKKNEKPKHQEKSSILNHKITKPDKPFPQCLMPDDEPCSSKSIVKAKDKPWYEIKTVPELPFDKAPKIYIPPDNILMKPPYPTSQKNSRKSSHKSLTQKTSSVKPLKIPSVTTPAQRIQKLKAQTPLFSPPNDLPTSKPSPTVGRLYNQLTTKSPAVKTNDLQFDLKKFHNNRLEIDLNKDKLIKEKSYELLTEPPKPPTLPKKQPRTSETKNTIRNLLTIEKVKLQKKGGRNK